MTHKRSPTSRRQRLQRLQDRHDIKLLRYNERHNIWLHAYYDDILDEVVNRLHCEWNLIERGEVLIDSRNRGFFQRIT